MPRNCHKKIFCVFACFWGGAGTGGISGDICCPYGKHNNVHKRYALWCVLVVLFCLYGLMFSLNVKGRENAVAISKNSNLFS